MKKKTENLISLAEFRQYFGVPARTLRYWISTGRIPVVKIPNGRGGFSKRIRRPATLADLMKLEKAISSRPARGPCATLPTPDFAGFREAVRKFVQKKGEAYRKRGKPLIDAWRNRQKAAQAKWGISNAEVEKKLAEIAGKIPL